MARTQMSTARSSDETRRPPLTLPGNLNSRPKSPPIARAFVAKKSQGIGLEAA